MFRRAETRGRPSLPRRRALARRWPVAPFRRRSEPADARRPPGRGRRDHQFGDRPDQRVDAIRASGADEAAAASSASSARRARGRARDAGSAPARRAPPPARPAPPCPASRGPSVIGTIGSTCRIRCAIRSPPWFTSATSRSARWAWNVATARSAQACGEAPAHALVLDHLGRPFLRRSRPARRPPPRSRIRRSRAARSPAGRSPPPPGRASRIGSAPRRLDHLPRPQRALVVAHDLAVELLPLEMAAGVARRHRPRGSSRRGASGSPSSTPGVITVPGASSTVLSSGVHCGVVVTTARGMSPRRSANCSMSQASTFGHFASSSHQAASNCGPRRLSGLLAEKVCATAPFGQTSRLPARLPLRPPVGRRAGEDARGTEHHHLARLVEGRADQGDPGTPSRVARLAPFDLRADPFGPRAGLACPPAAEDEPGRPRLPRGAVDARAPSARTARARTSGHSHSVRRETSRAHLAAAQTERRATISARAASRSSSPAPPAHSLLRLPILPSLSRTVCKHPAGASLIDFTSVFLSSASSPTPAFRDVIRSLRATDRSRYNSNVRPSQSLSPAHSPAELVM